MTRTDIRFDGLTDGANITTTAGLPGVTAVTNSSGSMSADATAGALGVPMGIDVNASATSGANHLSVTFTAAPAVALFAVYTFTAYPSGELGVMRCGPGATQVSVLGVTSAGKLLLRDGSGGVTAITGVDAIVLNTPMVFELYTAHGTTTSNGAQTYRVWKLSDGTDLFAGTLTASNTGTVDLDTIRWGKSGSGTAAGMGMSMNGVISYDTAVTGLIGLPWVWPVPPAYRHTAAIRGASEW